MLLSGGLRMISYITQTTDPRVVLPIMGCILLHQLLIRKIIHRTRYQDNLSFPRDSNLHQVYHKLNSTGSNKGQYVSWCLRRDAAVVIAKMWK